MTKRDEAATLQQMLDYSREVIALTAGKSRETLTHNRVLELALIRLLEMIGEAANRLPEDLRKRYPAIPWRQMIGLRNRLIHGYDSVDRDILWQIIGGDLPGLLRELDATVAAEQQA